MNERAATSVNALTKSLPFGIPDDLLLFSIFGSQVKGTERPDSDLDVLFVVRTSKASPFTAVRNAVTKTPGGVSKATVIPHTPDTFAWTADVYGTVEYGVLREEGARTLYRSAGFGARPPDIDYDYSAGRWLDMARKGIFPEEDRSGSWPGTACLHAHMAACDLLRAGLMAARIKFPFTRDVRVLYGMLPPERRPPLDVDAVEAIQERYDEDSDEKSWSLADVLAARDLVKPAYNFARKTIKPVDCTAAPAGPARAHLAHAPAAPTRIC